MSPMKRNASVIVFDPRTQTLSTEKLKDLGGMFQSILSFSDVSVHFSLLRLTDPF